jgi:hypothetical protein
MKIEKIVFAIALMILVLVAGCAKTEEKTTAANTAPLDCIGTAKAISDLVSSGNAVGAVEQYFVYESEAEKQQRIYQLDSPNEDLKNDIIRGFANPEIVFDGSSYCELEYVSSIPDFGNLTIILLRNDYTGDWRVTGF